MDLLAIHDRHGTVQFEQATRQVYGYSVYTAGNLNAYHLISVSGYL